MKSFEIKCTGCGADLIFGYTSPEFTGGFKAHKERSGYSICPNKGCNVSMKAVNKSDIPDLEAIQQGFKSLKDKKDKTEWDKPYHLISKEAWGYRRRVGMLDLLGSLVKDTYENSIEAYVESKVTRTVVLTDIKKGGRVAKYTYKTGFPDEISQERVCKLNQLCWEIVDNFPEIVEISL